MRGGKKKDRCILCGKPHRDDERHRTSLASMLCIRCALLLYRKIIQANLGRAS